LAKKKRAEWLKIDRAPSLLVENKVCLPLIGGKKPHLLLIRDLTVHEFDEPISEEKTLLSQPCENLSNTVNDLSISLDFQYIFFPLLTDVSLSTSSALLENPFPLKNSPSTKPTSIWRKTIDFFFLEW